MWEFWLGYWWAALIYGLAFGFVTKIVIKNKGYPEGKWFWWGFFFGVFALIAKLQNNLLNAIVYVRFLAFFELFKEKYA